MHLDEVLVYLKEREESKPKQLSLLDAISEKEKNIKNN